MPAESLTRPVERRKLVRQLAQDDCPVADRVLDLPALRTLRVIEYHRDRRHVRVVEEQPRADLQSRREVPPVENRIGETMGAVEQGEIELCTGEARQHVVRVADLERDAIARDAE